MENGSTDNTAGPEPQVYRTEQPPLTSDELSVPTSSHGVTSTRESRTIRQSLTKKRGKCRYFASKKGCRAGADCPYIHASPTNDQSVTSADQQSESPAPVNNNQNLDRNISTGASQTAISSGPSRQVTTISHAAQPQRPVSKAEQKDPREFQLNQLRRRFQPKETTDSNGSILEFGLAPSDPDFPFELDKLQCVLHVPKSYPDKGRPTLKVTNPEMEAAYQANVARGFNDIVDFTLRTNGRGVLLNWLNSLDKQLEKLLTTLERGPKLTFVANLGDGTASKGPAQTNPGPQRQVELPVLPKAVPVNAAKPVTPLKAPVTRITYTAAQKFQAEKRRSTEAKQLEARLGRLPLFQKRSDNSFVIPIQPNKKDRLPGQLQALKTVKLLVPQLYPLENSTIEIQGIDKPEARSVENGFAEWVSKNSQLNLVSQINYLASNMHNFAKTPLPEVAEYSQHEYPQPTIDTVSDEQDVSPEKEPSNPVEGGEDPDRPHLHVIPRPMEWSVPDHNNEGDETDDSSFEEDSEEDEEDSSDGGAPVPVAIDTPGRGVALSFPFLELYGIELLELMYLAITIKCERCKESMDIKNVPNLTDPKNSPKVESCRKCANSMSIGFRKQLMHSHANRAGYLDLDGCTIVDLLPSNFIPTCSECSTPYHAPGVSAVRGESSMAMCRHCHKKMVFKMPEVKFLIVGTAAVSSRSGLSLKRKPKEVLGIVAGQELPRRGRCQHYAKSFRWFRFSCCAKVFPCDKCHDAEMDHPNEHANRMICGFCSREQHFRPENCGTCKAVLVGKAGSGFWEGGKGTRNRALMSRKDPRKYKRQGSTVPGGSSSKKK
ncbi:hypothetical protein N7520_006464 [Penicillium odoratum]|uniref:uncharacterized protein n=1 Tax=Penicillium odoratum TaxID=1167516 RepID=UPI002546EFBD|nr:uncharacterized protein N7520_006464 [Penicillium odoratum]KAJ5759308.1 hypothetical protein N7520_006464 [Penicillium odoratum]